MDLFRNIFFSREEKKIDLSELDTGTGFTMQEMYTACSSFLKENKREIIAAQPEDRKSLAISLIDRMVKD